MAIYGYSRVSIDGQSLAAQEAELTAAGCAKVFAEKSMRALSSLLHLSLLQHVLPPTRRTRCTTAAAHT